MLKTENNKKKTIHTQIVEEKKKRKKNDAISIEFEEIRLIKTYCRNGVYSVRMDT